MSAHETTAAHEAFLKAVDLYCEGLTIAPGAAAVCAECISQYGIDDTGDIEAMQDELYQHDEGSFSWSQCDSCGSSLGGDRHSAHGLPRDREADPDIYHFEICTDCLLFHANGDLPEQWT